MTRRWCQWAAMAACASLLALGEGAGAQNIQPVAAPVAWGTLSVQQRTTLAPLATEWLRLPPAVQHKWIEIANRLPSMPADQQQRVQERMREWARLSPEQRTEARLNFQQSRQLGGADKQARWEAYQALSVEERQALGAKARAASAPTMASSPTHALRKAPLGAMAPKSNVIDSTPLPAAQTLRPVAPAVVQAKPGVTTTLVSVKQPMPPDHQKVGQPKIAARPGMVDRSTLLPKHGPQAQGIVPATKPPVVAVRSGAGSVPPAAVAASASPMVASAVAPVASVASSAASPVN